MFIRDCVQSFMMDGKEVVILIHVFGGSYFDFYAIPVEVADELNLDEYAGMNTEDDEEALEELLDKIREFRIEDEHSKKIHYVNIHTSDTL